MVMLLGSISVVIDIKFSVDRLKIIIIKTSLLLTGVYMVL